VYRTPLTLHKGLHRGETPIVYVMINTPMGWRGYSTKEINSGFTEESPRLADGTITADGTYTAGAGDYGMLDLQGRIVSIGKLSRTIRPSNTDIIGAYQNRQLQHISFTLADHDDYFTKMLPSEPLLNSEVRIYVGFDSDPHTDHLRIFNGYISSIKATSIGVEINAEERFTLGNTFFLTRSGRYSEPLYTNDRLPIVYGDLTDGSLGNWVLPCIDVDAAGGKPVYCFAAHEVLSVANGNTITIYENDLELNSALYTFDEANDYEGLGTIATITFTSPKTGSIITARGKGKPTASGGATLMENIIDIIYDFLTVHNSLTSANFNSTSKAKAQATFTAQSYKAAGVIGEDIGFWELIQRMMGSFFGSCYLDANNLLCLDIETNTVNEADKVAIFRYSDIVFAEGEQTLENLINQCPASYGYDYARGSEFNYHTDDSAHGDAISQSVYGIRKPAQPYRFYWCRDLTTVNAIQDIIVAKLKDPLWMVRIDDLTLTNIHVDVGDIIVATIKRLYDRAGDQLINHLWRVTGVQPNLKKRSITYTLEDTGQFAYIQTYLADGSYKADGSIHAGSDRDTTEY